MKVGISFVSCENALENLEAEAGELSFDEVRRNALADWEEALSVIDMESEDEEIKKSAKFDLLWLYLNGSFRVGDFGFDNQNAKNIEKAIETSIVFAEHPDMIDEEYADFIPVTTTDSFYELRIFPLEYGRQKLFATVWYSKDKEINLKRDLESDNSIFKYYKKLADMRQEYSSIVNGDLQFLLEDNSEIIAYTRTDKNQTILVVANYNSPTEKFCVEEDGNSFIEVRDLSNLFEGTIISDLTLINQVLMQYPYADNYNYMFKDSTIKDASDMIFPTFRFTFKGGFLNSGLVSDVDLPLNVADVEDCFKDCLNMVSIRSQWNKDFIYDDLVYTNCYYNCVNIIDL